MNALLELFSPISFSRIVILVMLAVLFIQSGLDKVTDRAGNLDWLTGHFASSPFAKIVSVLLTVITVMELSAGLASLGGAIEYSIFGGLFWGKIGSQLACVSILMLFSGQRVAKDYAGAASLVPYFLMALVALLLFEPELFQPS